MTLQIQALHRDTDPITAFRFVMLNGFYHVLLVSIVCLAARAIFDMEFLSAVCPSRCCIVPKMHTSNVL